MRLEKVDVYREDITKVNHVAWELFTVPTQHCQYPSLTGFTTTINRLLEL